MSNLFVTLVMVLSIAALQCLDKQVRKQLFTGNRKVIAVYSYLGIGVAWLFFFLIPGLDRVSLLWLGLLTLVWWNLSLEDSLQHSVSGPKLLLGCGLLLGFAYMQNQAYEQYLYAAILVSLLYVVARAYEAIKAKQVVGEADYLALFGFICLLGLEQVGLYLITVSILPLLTLLIKAFKGQGLSNQVPFLPYLFMGFCLLYPLY